MVNLEQQATANRAIRSIRNELEYLSDLNIITPQQLSSLLTQIPTEIHHVSSNPSLQNPLLPTTTTTATTPLIQNNIGLPSDPAPPSLNNNNNNEKQQTDFYAPSPSPAQALPPPAYEPTPPAPPSLAIASALYEYKPSDAGDLAILPSDRISITEFMNADWAKGLNQRTGLEGIFPRSYVTMVEGEKEGGRDSIPFRPATTTTTATSSYGNLPLDVSQSGGSNNNAPGGKESKLNQHGKKFGKKLGNATIFGAGATIGSNIVNGIF